MSAHASGSEELEVSQVAKRPNRGKRQRVRSARQGTKVTVICFLFGSKEHRTKWFVSRQLDCSSRGLKIALLFWEIFHISRIHQSQRRSAL